MKPTFRNTFLVLLFLVAACSADPDSPAGTASDNGLSGTAAIAIPDPYAADVAERILRQGGNAVDAAIATGVALAVTYFDAGNYIDALCNIHSLITDSFQIIVDLNDGNQKP